MKKTKLEKGITLIALIITIVVLLILAVVTIGAIQESKIIAHAQKAKNDYTVAQERELIALGFSEYMIEKNISDEAQLKVEEATVTGTEKSGWEVRFDKTNNAYEVDKNGNVEIAKEIVISEEKDIGAITYMYRTIYNPNQPEVIPAEGYYNDENDDKIDDDSSMTAMIDNSYFNIKNTFFEQDMPTEGNINAKVTHFDGRVEDIILTTTDNKAWSAEIKFPLIGENIKGDIVFRPNAKYKNVYRAEPIDCYEESAEYHYMYIPGGVWIPLQKIEILGKTIEFPYERQDIMGWFWEEYETYSMFDNAKNVTKIILNFSDNTQKIYNSDKIISSENNLEDLMQGFISGEYIRYRCNRCRNIRDL